MNSNKLSVVFLCWAMAAAKIGFSEPRKLLYLKSQIAPQALNKKSFLYEVRSKFKSKNSFRVRVTHSQASMNKTVCYKKPARQLDFLAYDFIVAQYHDDLTPSQLEFAEFDLEEKKWNLAMYVPETKKFELNPDGCFKCHGPKENPHLILMDYNLWPGWDLVASIHNGHEIKENEDYRVKSLIDKVWFEIDGVSKGHESKEYKINKEHLISYMKKANLMYDLSIIERIENHYEGKVPRKIKGILLFASTFSIERQKELNSALKYRPFIGFTLMEYFDEDKVNEKKCIEDAFNDFYKPLYYQFYYNDPDFSTLPPLLEEDFSFAGSPLKSIWKYTINLLGVDSIASKTFNKSNAEVPCATFDGTHTDRAFWPVFYKYVLKREIPKDFLKSKLRTEKISSFGFLNDLKSEEFKVYYEIMEIYKNNELIAPEKLDLYLKFVN